MRIHPSARRGEQVLARTLYRQLAEHGLDARQIVGVATELIGEVTHHIEAERRVREGDDPGGRAA